MTTVDIMSLVYIFFESEFDFDFFSCNDKYVTDYFEEIMKKNIAEKKEQPYLRLQSIYL